MKKKLLLLMTAVSMGVTSWAQVPKADLLDVVFNDDGTATDISASQNNVELFGIPRVVKSSKYGMNVACFHDNGLNKDCAYWYKVDYGTNIDVSEGLANGHSMEVLCRLEMEGEYTDNLAADEEIKPFSSMQGGGTGFLVSKQNRGLNSDSKNEWTFLPHVGGGYVYANSGVLPKGGEYVHLVGVWDKEKGEARIYVNGELKYTNPTANGDFKHSSLPYFVIGGDPGGDAGANTSFKGDVAIARVYDDPLTDDQVASLFNAVKAMDTGTEEHNEADTHDIEPTGDYMQFELGDANQVSITETENFSYIVVTSGTDPFVRMSALNADLTSEESAVEFEYKTSVDIPGAEFFFSLNGGFVGGREQSFDIPAATEWTKMQVDISGAKEGFDWGYAGDFLRFDFGTQSGVTFYVRNIHIVKPEAIQYDIDLPVVDGYVQLSTAEDLEKFAGYVNEKGMILNATLTQDIDYSGHTTFIGTSAHKYAGVFDGAQHTITVDFNRNSNDAALFQCLSGTVKNLTVRGNITTSAKYAAGIAAHTYHARVLNCVSLVNIVSSINGDGTHAGFVAVNEEGLTISDCIFLGSITGDVTTCCAGIVGWSTNTTNMNNCVLIADLTGLNVDGSNTFSRNSGNATITNCYYNRAHGTAEAGTKIDVTPENLANGGVCFTVNGDQSEIHFYQNIGTDEYPVPWSNHAQVYAAGNLRCDGMPIDDNVTYSNTESSDLPNHQYENGVCVVCGKSEPGFVELIDGYYHIAEAKQLVWYSNFVNSGNPKANGKLVADIDMIDESANFTPIGFNGVNFNGTFDGQGHRISNLVVNLDVNCAGLFGYVQAPCTIQNLVLDETCSITGAAYSGLIGESVGGVSGNINMTNLGNEGNVTCSGVNAGGIIGCCMSSSATFIMNRCYVTGTIIGGSETAALSGWFGSEGQATDCWSTATVSGYDGESTYLGRGTVTLTRVYSTAGTQGTIVPANAGASGELCWTLNGKSMLNPTWYQTLEEDTHPVFDSTHGVVYMNDDGTCGDIHDEASFIEYRDRRVADDQTYLDGHVATVSLVEEYSEVLKVVAAMTNKDEFFSNLSNIDNLLSQVKSSANAYEAYFNQVDYVNTYLDENKDFDGPDRALLEDYLESFDGPSENFPNGTFGYIEDNHDLTTAEIKEETEFVKQLLEKAVANGYTTGSEITKLLVNPDFSNGFNGWSGKAATGTSYSSTSGFYGAECWNNTFDMYQTLTDMREGVYMLEVNGSFRPHNTVTNTNYAASIYLNENMVYMPSVLETYIPVDEAQDGINCNLTGGVNDLDVTDEEGNVIGYAMHGILSIANGAAGGRALNTLVANVGEDGKLTVGIKSPGTGTGNDWTGMANCHLYYLGTLEEANSALDKTLEGQMARAKTLIETVPNEDSDYALIPNFQQALKDQLQESINAVSGASSVEEKYALIQKFSQLFEEVYRCKQAYIAMMNLAEDYFGVASELSPDYISKEDADAIANANDQAWSIYLEGSYSTDEALAMTFIKSLPINTEIDENGVYQINNNAQYLLFARDVNAGNTSANAVLNADIEYCTEAQMLTNYYGTLDGQYHTITINMVRSENDAAIVQNLYGAVRNLTVRGDIAISAKYAAAIAAHTYENAQIDNIASYINVASTIEGDGTHGGIVAVNEGGVIINNCLFAGTMTGGMTTCCGGIVGWSSSTSRINNCLQIGDIQVSTEGSNTFSRNSGNAVIVNSYYLNGFGAVEGTAIQTNEAQMASGELCYLLNEGSTILPAWGQNLGEDAYPVPDRNHKVVTKNEDGTYANTEGSDLTNHKGTADDPYPLSNVDELCAIRQLMRAGDTTYFVLTNDIDMSSVSNWTPVNMDYDVYAGKSWMNWIDFDGQGHVIRNFTCNGYDYGSFFGILCGNVRNVGFENVNVTCTSTGTGVLGGYMGHNNYCDENGNKYRSELSNVWVTGTLTGTTAYLGGLIGNIGGPSTFHNCYVNIEMTSAATYTGGLVGRIRDELTVQNAYAAGTCNVECGITGGGKNASTPASSFTNVVVWNNTNQYFGPTTDDDVLTGISYYDGSNFADLQKTAVAWGKPWSCDMADGSYPVLDLITGINQIAVGSGTNSTEDIYTITGMRVQKAQKGLYIINGKKILVK